MDYLRRLTPYRVRIESYLHLVAYNLIGQTLASTAARAGVERWTIRFKGTVQTLFKPPPLRAIKLSYDVWCDILLDAIATYIVGNRPGRNSKEKCSKGFREVQVPFVLTPFSQEFPGR